MSDARASEPRAVPRPQALEAGLFLLTVALPLAFFPLSEAAFVDVKLPVLALGTLLVWLSGVPVERRLAGPAVALGLAFAAASLVSVDPAASLVGNSRPTGLVTLVCALSLLPVAPSIPRALLGRARRWLVWTAVVVAGVAVLEHVAPVLLDRIAEGESFLGSTLGNPVFLIAFLAAAIPAALEKEQPRWRTALVFASLGAGFAVAGERSAYLLPLVAFVFCVAWVRPSARVVAIALGTLVAAFAMMTIATALASDAGPTRVAGQFATLGVERQRLAVWGAQSLAVAERPVFGWGPGNEWNAFVASATRGQISTAGRFWGDAHNLFIEIPLISGVVGLAAFAWLLSRLIPAMLRSSRSGRWAAASASTLGVYFLYEPMDVTLVPIMLVLAGASIGPPDSPPPAARPRRNARAAVVAVLVASTVIGTVGLVSSSLEQWARTHAGSRWAFERAWAIAPWRISAAEGLAVDLAIDGRAGDVAAAAEARDVVNRLVIAHPTSPGVRLLAADVELLLRDFDGMQAWIREHLRLFPNDDVRVPEEEPGFSIDVPDDE